MKRLVFALGLALCLTGSLWAAEPEPAAAAQDLRQLEAAIFQAPPAEGEDSSAQVIANLKPGGQSRDHCGVLPGNCVYSRCLCFHACEDCGGVQSFTCNPHSCTCVTPGCPL